MDRLPVRVGEGHDDGRGLRAVFFHEGGAGIEEENLLAESARCHLGEEHPKFLHTKAEFVLGGGIRVEEQPAVFSQNAMAAPVDIQQLAGRVFQLPDEDIPDLAGRGNRPVSETRFGGSRREGCLALLQRGQQESDVLRRYPALLQPARETQGVLPRPAQTPAAWGVRVVLQPHDDGVDVVRIDAVQCSHVPMASHTLLLDQ